MGPQNPAVATRCATASPTTSFWLPESRSPASKPAEAQATFDVRLSSDDPIRPDQMVWDRERDEGTSDQRVPGRRATRRRRPAFGAEFRAHRYAMAGRRHSRSRREHLAADARARLQTRAQLSADVVAGFIELLCAVRDLSRRGQFVLAGETSNALPEDQQLRFRRAVERYRGSSA
jgi:hypothetical protein